MQPHIYTKLLLFLVPNAADVPFDGPSASKTAYFAVDGPILGTSTTLCGCYLDYCCAYANFAATKNGGTICRGARVPGPRLKKGTCAEESPHRTGHPSAESAAGSNLWQAVTENNRRKVRVKTRGKSPRLFVATHSGYRPRACKTKYTGR